MFKDKPTRKAAKFLFIIVFLSLSIKLIFLFTSGVYKYPQTFEYEDVAVNLLNGQGAYYEHFQTRYYSGIAPGFPILCFIIYRLFGHNPLWVILLQILVTSLMAVPIYFIARRVFEEKTAFFAGILCALQPQFIIYSTSKAHAMNIYAFIFVILVLFFLRLREQPNVKNACIVGVISGLAILFRITSLVFVLLGIFWFFFVSRIGNKNKLKIIIIIISAVFILLLPWGIRNYAIYRKPLFLQSNKWESLWFGNVPGSSGALYTEGGIDILEKNKDKLPAGFFTLDETKQGEAFKKMTAEYFKNDPMGFMIRILKKVYYFWYFSPYQGTLYPSFWMDIYKIYYLFILPLAFISPICNFCIYKNSDRTGIFLILLLFVAITATHSLYFVEGRHRWSIESFIVMFAANGFVIITYWISNFFNHKRFLR